MFFPQELRRTLAYHGVEIESESGDFLPGDVRGDSESLAVVCRRMKV